MLTLTRLAQVTHEYVPASCCHLSWVCEQIHILELYDDSEWQKPVMIILNVMVSYLANTIGGILEVKFGLATRR